MPDLIAIVKNEGNVNAKANDCKKTKFLLFIVLDK